MIKSTPRFLGPISRAFIALESAERTRTLARSLVRPKVDGLLGNGEGGREREGAVLARTRFPRRCADRTDREFCPRNVSFCDPFSVFFGTE